MTNDKSPRSCGDETHKVASNKEQPLQPNLNLDVSPLNSEAAEAIIAADLPTQEALHAVFTLLYDKVTSVQKNEKKAMLIFQVLCQLLNQAHFVELMPQIEVFRTLYQQKGSYINDMITQISLDIDRGVYPEMSPRDLFGGNSSFTKVPNQYVNPNCDSKSSTSITRLDDFFCLGLIAKGGFGSVYKMQNLTDKCTYAIKAIPFKSRNQVDANKIMREVYYAANLPSHQNIVSYKSSWLDHYIKDFDSKSHDLSPRAQLGQEAVEFLSSTDSSESSRSKSTAAKEDVDISVSVEPKVAQPLSKPLLAPSPFRPEEIPSSAQSVSQDLQSTSSAPKSVSSKLSSSSFSSSSPSLHPPESSFSGLAIEFASNSTAESVQFEQSQNDDQLKRIDGGDNLALTRHPFKRPMLYYCILCIQMELCAYNLRTWIDKRNKDLHSGRVLTLNYDRAIDIFIQTVKGVHHLHSHNLIHRDIKPHNILLSASGVVKIGDFGLTTLNELMEIQEDETICWSGNVQNRTRGLGTSSYSAPEQLNSHCYNSKADIYSLGLIAFELLYPLYTDMERSDRFEKLRNDHILPEELYNYPPFADLILETVNENPSVRPDSATILAKESILRYGWKLNTDQPSYEDLKEIAKVLNEKVIKLEQTIKSKDSEILELKKRLKDQD